MSVQYFMLGVKEVFVDGRKSIGHEILIMNFVVGYFSKYSNYVFKKYLKFKKCVLFLRIILTIPFICQVSPSKNFYSKTQKLFNKKMGKSFDTFAIPSKWETPSSLRLQAAVAFWYTHDQNIFIYFLYIGMPQIYFRWDYHRLFIHIMCLNWL